MKQLMPLALILSLTLAASAAPGTQSSTAPVRLTPTTQFFAPNPLPYESTGSLVTLHLKDATAREAFDGLASQAQTTLGAWPATLWDVANRSRITADVQDVPFWEAMRELCPKLGMYPMALNEPRVFLSMNVGNTTLIGPGCQRGPVLLVADTLVRTHNLAFAKPEDVSDICTIGFNLFIEPRLGVVRRSINPTLTEAVDENGRSLIMGDIPEAQMTSDGRCCVRMQAMLSLPRGAGTRLAHLKGTLRLTVRARSRTWEAPVAVGQPGDPYDVAGRRMIAESLEKKGLIYALHWSLFRNGASADEWNKLREMTLPNAPGVRLVDARGQLLARYNRSPAESDADHLTFQFDFRKDRRGDPAQASDPVKLVWEEVQETREMTLPFEFTDLPLP